MILNINSLTDLSGFYVIYNSTIRNESNGNRGISHFIEHLMCKEFDDMLDDFERNGINWNAYTSDTRIVFYITGLDEYMSRYRDNFVDRLSNFSVTKEDLETERKIIIEEYTDAFNKQSSAHFLNLYRKLFNNYNPIGDIHDINNITLDMCVSYKEKYYNTPSKIINVSKSSKYESDISFNDFDNNYIVDYIKDNMFNYQKTNIFKSKMSMIYLSKIIDKDLPVVSFITALLGNGLKSPLYKEIRESSGLVYYIYCYLDHLSDNSGVINISTESNDENVEEINDKLRYILDNKEKFITRDRFDIVKRSYDIYYKKSNINRYNNINKYLTPKKWLIEPVLNELTLDLVYEVFDKYFIFDDFYISYDKKEFLGKNDI